MRLAAVLVVTVLAGCNQILGIGDVSTGGPGGPFHVVSTTPAADAPAADVEAPLSVTFSGAVDASTVTTATIVLTHMPDGAVIATTPSASGDTVTLALAAPLDFLDGYRLTIDAAVAATSGVALGTPVTVDFTARDGVWTAVMPVKPVAVGATIEGAHVAAAPDGVWVTWTEKGSTEDAYVARVSPTGAWDPPTQLDSVDGLSTSIGAPTAIVGKTGHALVKWPSAGGLNTAEYVRTFDPGAGWTDAMQMTGAHQASPPDPVAGVGPDGMMYLAYAGTTDPQPPTMTRVRDGAGTWAAAQVFDPTAAPLVMRALGPGNALMLYGTSGGLYESSYRPSDGTFPPAGFFLIGTGAGQSIDCVSDAQGDDGFFEPVIRFQDNGVFTVHGRPSLDTFSTTSADVGCPAAAVDPSENFLMVWPQGQGAAASIRARRSVVNVGQEAEVRVDDPAKGASSLPQVVLDFAGRGEVVWAQTDGVTPAVHARRFRPGVGWSATIDDVSASASIVESIELAPGPRGRALALIQRADGYTFAVYH